jgi:hypothetical protein
LILSPLFQTLEKMHNGNGDVQQFDESRRQGVSDRSSRNSQSPDERPFADKKGTV